MKAPEKGTGTRRYEIYRWMSDDRLPAFDVLREFTLRPFLPSLPKTQSDLLQVHVRSRQFPSFFYLHPCFSSILYEFITSAIIFDIVFYGR